MVAFSLPGLTEMQELATGPLSQRWPNHEKEGPECTPLHTRHCEKLHGV